MGNALVHHSYDPSNLNILYISVVLPETQICSEIRHGHCKMF